MTAIKAHIKAWSLLTHHKKMWFGLYAIQLLIALLAAFPFVGYLGKTVGHSLDLTNSLGRFDYTFINDFLLTHGSGFQVLLNQSIGFLLLYFLIALFLMGGIITIIKSWRGTDSLNGFFLGAGHFFWRLLRLSFYFLIPQLLLLGIMGGIFLKWTHNMSPFELESELVIINAAYTLVPLYLVLASFIFMVHDLAKILLAHRDESRLTSIIRDSYSMALFQFRKYYPVYLLNIFVFVLLTLLYYFVNSFIAPTSTGQVLLFFLLGQFYLFFRMGLKVVNLAALNEVYEGRE